ncbi:MAG: hypothetical protein ACRD8U_16110 [Pyrinomonadaceae bacterium]
MKRQLRVSQAARLFTVAFLVLRGDLARADERVGDIKLRSALLTASSFGNAFATSGSSTITFVDSRIRFCILARTSSPKSDRLYSGRDQSLSSDLAFFQCMNYYSLRIVLLFVLLYAFLTRFSRW